MKAAAKRNHLQATTEVLSKKVLADVGGLAGGSLNG